VSLDHLLDQTAEAIDRALAAGDTTGAVAACLGLLRLHPDRAAVLCFAIRRFRKLRFFGQAFSLLDQLRAHCLNKENLAIDEAWSAHDRRNYHEALLRWNVIRSRFPINVLGYTGAAATVREAGNFPGAMALIETAIESFPNDPRPQIERAYLALALGNVDEAVLRWEVLRNLFPRHPACYVGGADALRAAGRIEEAEALRSQWHGALTAEATIVIQEQHRRIIERWRESRRLELMSIMHDKRLALPDLVQRYMTFAGPSWPEMRREVFDEMSRLDGADDPSHGFEPAGVTGQDLRLSAAFLARINPDLKGSYFRPSDHQEFTCHELLAASPNPLYQRDARPPFDRAMGRAERPALLAYRASGHDLLVSPIGYMLFDDTEGVYWPAAATHVYARQAVPGASTVIDRPVVIIQDKFEGTNFSHFLFDWIPRLVHFVEARLEDRRRCWFLMGGIPGNFHRRIITSICESHDLDPEQFIFPSETAVWRCTGDIWFFSDLTQDISHPAHIGHERSMRVVRQVSMGQKIEAGRVERLYITRNDTRLRRISNERALWMMLRARGFSMVRLADVDIERQIALFRGGKFIVGAHGMGLTHLVFHQGGPCVIELHNPMIGTDAYAIMSLASGFLYYPVHGAEDDAANGHFHVDVMRIDAILNSLGVERNVVPEQKWDFAEGWFPGTQSVLAALTTAVDPPQPGFHVMRHFRDDAVDQPDNNVGWRLVDGLHHGTAYTASCWIWIPEGFDGEIFLHWQDPRHSQMSWADLTRRDAWQKIAVGSTASEPHIHIVLRVHAAAGDHIFSSCWTIEEGVL
jgi:capsular polysaccharide biosynthesis protein